MSKAYKFDKIPATGAAYLEAADREDPISTFMVEPDLKLPGNFLATQEEVAGDKTGRAIPLSEDGKVRASANAIALAKIEGDPLAFLMVEAPSDYSGAFVSTAEEREAARAANIYDRRHVVYESPFVKATAAAIDLAERRGDPLASRMKVPGADYAGPVLSTKNEALQALKEGGRKPYIPLDHRGNFNATREAAAQLAQERSPLAERAIVPTGVDEEPIVATPKEVMKGYGRGKPVIALPFKP